jgi:hypothetical protein
LDFYRDFAFVVDSERDFAFVVDFEIFRAFLFLPQQVTVS